MISLAVAAAGWVLLVTRRLRRYPISTTFETPPDGPLIVLLEHWDANAVSDVGSAECVLERNGNGVSGVLYRLDREVRVARRCLDLGMAEQLSDHR